MVIITKNVNINRLFNHFRKQRKYRLYPTVKQQSTFFRKKKEETYIKRYHLIKYTTPLVTYIYIYYFIILYYITCLYVHEPL